MKMIFLKIVFVVGVIASTVSCKCDKKNETTAKEADAVAVAPVVADKYKAIAAESTINWSGSKPTGTHTGTISIESGAVSIKEGKIESGTFLIDMKTITVTDLEPGKGKEDLEAHLKGTVEDKKDHFFDVADHPSAAFEVTSSSEVNGKTVLEGNLTIKGIKKNISFPVSVSQEGDIMTLTSETFTINRTDWGINYKSKTIFGDLGDKFVNDDIELKITLKASKA